MGKSVLRKVQVWIYRKEGSSYKVLLLKTLPDRGGTWQPVTGGVEEGESFESAALREAEEETGLSFLAGLTDLEFEFAFNGRWGRAVERGYALQAVPKGTIVIDPIEHTDFQWVELRSAKKLLSFQPQIECLTLLTNKLSVY